MKVIIAACAVVLSFVQISGLAQATEVAKKAPRTQPVLEGDTVWTQMLNIDHKDRDGKPDEQVLQAREGGAWGFENRISVIGLIRWVYAQNSGQCPDSETQAGTKTLAATADLVMSLGLVDQLSQQIQTPSKGVSVDEVQCMSSIFSDVVRKSKAKENQPN